jgi:hypothetical protein
MLHIKMNQNGPEVKETVHFNKWILLLQNAQVKSNFGTIFKDQP